jgi:putative ABC transport system permease protein
VHVLHAVDPGVPAFDIKTMDLRFYESMARERFAMVMFGLFAAFALVLSSIGVYGVMSYLVTQTTREIGVRVALGATRRNIIAIVLRQGLLLAGAGILAGLVASLGLTRLMASLLYGVTPHDLPTFAGVAVFLGAVAVAATYIPAFSATRIDPMVALRYE